MRLHRFRVKPTSGTYTRRNKQKVPPGGEFTALPSEIVGLEVWIEDLGSIEPEPPAATPKVVFEPDAYTEITHGRTGASISPRPLTHEEIAPFIALSRDPAERKPWVVPDLWRGETVVVIGGGPIVAGLIGDERLRGRRLIACNMAFRHFPEADAMVFGESSFPGIALKARAPLAEFGGLRVTIADAYLNSALPCLYVAKDGNKTGISRDPSVLRWNFNTGALGIGLARHLGASRIVLVGFEMRMVDGRRTYHDAYAQTPVDFDRQIAPYKRIAKDLAAEGVQVINATPGSAIDAFPLASLDEALA